MPDDLCVGDVDPAGELAHGYLGGVVELPEKNKKEGSSGERKQGQKEGDQMNKPEKDYHMLIAQRPTEIPREWQRER